MSTYQSHLPFFCSSLDLKNKVNQSATQVREGGAISDLAVSPQRFRQADIERVTIEIAVGHHLIASLPQRQKIMRLLASIWIVI